MHRTARPARFGDRSAWGRRIGRTLIAIGILMVLYWTSGFGLGIWRQLSDEARWDRRVATTAAEGPSPGGLARPVDGMDFKLVVPKLGYHAVVREGVGLDVLTSGPGHYPGTAWPGKAGVVGIAAHNVYWIRFDQLRAGDRMVIQTRYGAFDYRITGSRVVRPDDTSVLRPELDRRLTLTTCWPLWAGELARERLAIFADGARAI